MATKVQCPAWCDWSVEHDDPDDIAHMNDERTVDLSLMPPVDMIDYTDMSPYQQAAHMSVYLIQHEGEAAPGVHLGKDDQVGVTLTLDETMRLVLVLVNQLTAAGWTGWTS